MRYKKVTEHEAFEKNPFLEKAMEEISVKQRKQLIRPTKADQGLLVVSEKTGAVEGHTAFMRFIEVDENQFAKIYINEISALFNLTKSAIRVLGYLLTALKPNNDSVLFILEDCMTYTKYKHKKDVFSGLASLMEANIIARSRHDFMYFINPLIFFNGNRITFAKSYIKKMDSTDITKNSTSLGEYIEQQYGKALPSNNESGE